jgi:CheY-like chemotaxis protein
VAKLHSSGRRILVVDDEALVADTLKGLLAEEGFKVEVVTGGLEALAALERSAFDVVITDYLMPGLNGDQLAHEIKTRVRGQKIVLLTGLEEKLNSSHYPLPVELVMAKPFNLQQFLHAINTLLGQQVAGTTADQVPLCLPPARKGSQGPAITNKLDGLAEF